VHEKDGVKTRTGTRIASVRPDGDSRRKSPASPSRPGTLKTKQPRSGEGRDSSPSLRGRRRPRIERRCDTTGRLADTLVFSAGGPPWSSDAVQRHVDDVVLPPRQRRGWRWANTLHSGWPGSFKHCTCESTSPGRTQPRPPPPVRNVGGRTDSRSRDLGGPGAVADQPRTPGPRPASVTATARADEQVTESSSGRTVSAGPDISSLPANMLQRLLDIAGQGIRQRSAGPDDQFGGEHLTAAAAQWAPSRKTDD